MNKLKFASLAVLAIVAIAFTGVAIALAATAPPPLYTDTTPKVAVQPYDGISPTAGKSRCDTHADVTKGVFQQYTTAGYRDFQYSAFGDYSGNIYPPRVVKTQFNSETAYMPESSGRITGNSGLEKLVFDAPSSAKRNITTCIRR